MLVLVLATSVILVWWAIIVVLKFPVLTVLLSFYSQYGHTEYPLHNHTHSISRCFSLLSYLSLHSRSTEVRLFYTLFYCDTDPCSLS